LFLIKLICKEPIFLSDIVATTFINITYLHTHKKITDLLMNKDKKLTKSISQQQNNSDQIKINNSRLKRGRTSLDNTFNLNKRPCSHSATIESSESIQMEELKKLMEASFARAEKQQEIFRNEVNTKLSSIQESIQSQLDSLSSRVTALEASEGSSSNKFNDVRREISSVQSLAIYNTNCIAQKDLENDVIARGIPTIYSTKLDDLVVILNEKLRISLSPDKLDIQPPKSTQSHTGTYFFKFKTKLFKDDFMKAVNVFRNKDVIALEDLFQNYQRTNFAGTQVSFRNSLTKFSKSLLDAAISERRSQRIAHAWERDGTIYMRKREGDMKVVATSIDQIREFSSS
jgi:hypothetical protein